MDSWATDAHKFLNVPYDSGIVLTRHPRAHRRAMAVHAPYLPSGNIGSTPSPGVFSPELSRRARGFALWAALRQLGGEGLDALVRRCVSHARRFAEEVQRTSGLSVQNEVVFNQVVLGAQPSPGAERDVFTRGFVQAIQRDGTCYPTPTIWRGFPAVRFSFINADTTEADVVRSAEAVSRVYRMLAG
jgi:glutamate/tyrosine decarboxylase-like PLP-dependent enzyme